MLAIAASTPRTRPVLATGPAAVRRCRRRLRTQGERQRLGSRAQLVIV